MFYIICLFLQISFFLNIVFCDGIGDIFYDFIGIGNEYSLFDLSNSLYENRQSGGSFVFEDSNLEDVLKYIKKRKLGVVLYLIYL